MVNQRLALLISVTLFILVGCASNATPLDIKESATPTNTEVIIPSSTHLPTETATPIPTATLIIPTPTLYLTPLPTLSREQSWIQLYKSENKCDVPCWWGIIPGVSTWTETKQFIEHFSDPSFGFDKVIGEMHITKSAPSDNYMWHVWPPASSADTSTTVFLEVQNNIVTAIEIPADLVSYFFPVHKLLEVYGQPDKVLVFISNYDTGSSTYNAFIFIVYEDKHVLVDYHYFGPETTNFVNLCLNERNEQSMYLWAPDTELNLDFSKLKQLDEYSELNSKTFYERFKDQNNKCFEMSRDVWK